jgi:hypothetical protein
MAWISFIASMTSFLQKLVGVARFIAPFQSHEKEKFSK